MRPSEVIAALRAQLAERDALIDVLKGALSADGAEVIAAAPAALVALSPQERAFVGVLFRAYPRAVDAYVLLDLLPSRDHARERDLSLVTVLAWKVRKKLGADAITSARGRGYRLGAPLHATLVAQQTG